MTRSCQMGGAREGLVGPLIIDVAFLLPGEVKADARKLKEDAPEEYTDSSKRGLCGKPGTDPNDWLCRFPAAERRQRREVPQRCID